MSTIWKFGSAVGSAFKSAFTSVRNAWKPTPIPTRVILHRDLSEITIPKEYQTMLCHATPDVTPFLSESVTVKDHLFVVPAKGEASGGFDKDWATRCFANPAGRKPGVVTLIGDSRQTRVDRVPETYIYHNFFHNAAVVFPVSVEERAD